jgi:hypothetical protein
MEAKHNSTRSAADDTITNPGVYSFSWIRTTKDGDILDHEDFDVPLEPYGEGWSRGEAVAKECLTRAARNPSVPGGMLSVMKRAAEILAQSEADPDAPSRRGAAAGFLRTIERHAVAGFR